MRTKRKVIKGRKLNAGQRSLKWLDKHGYVAGVVERWLTYVGPQEAYIAELVEQRKQILAYLRDLLQNECHHSATVNFLGRLNTPMPPSGLPGNRVDLFGLFDLLAFPEVPQPWLDGHAVLGVQTTSRRQIAGHLRKYRRDPKKAKRIRDWLSHPAREFVIHGWECVEVPCTSKGTKSPTKPEWHLTERWVTPEDVGDDEGIVSEISPA